MRLSASGQGVPPGLSEPGPGGVLRRPRPRLRDFGGVPGTVRYDNLKAAVVRVMQGPRPDRVGALRGVALPLPLRLVLLPAGHRGRPRKGRGGRRDRPVPPPLAGAGPDVASLAELNELLAAGHRLNDSARHTTGAMTVAEHFAVERDLLRPLPGEPFQVARLCGPGSTPRPGRRCASASTRSRSATPARRSTCAWAPTVSRSSTAPGWWPATPEESARKRGPDLDHYLEVLAIKPGRSPGATALAQARAAGAVHQRPRPALGRGPTPSRRRGGTRALIEVLLAHRTMPAAAVIAGMDRAVGSADRPGRGVHRGPPATPRTRSPR